MREMGPVNRISAQGIKTCINSVCENILPSPQVYKPPSMAKIPVSKKRIPNNLFMGVHLNHTRTKGLRK